MVSLEQIRALEARVEKAVVLIDRLRKENAGLELRLAEVSRSQEQSKAESVELERKAAVSARAAAESAARLDELVAKARAAEDRIAEADLRAADAEERAAAFERKAVAAEAEVASYRERALAAERKASELDSRAEELRRDQSRIEEGLVHALEKLDAFEDLVMGRPREEGRSPENAIVDGTESGMAASAADFPEEVPFRSESDGDVKVEAAEESPTASAAQEPAFPGAEHELDIF
ncbi:MAG: hypothetical protein WBH97_00570 [Rectinemataceae bacterium]